MGKVKVDKTYTKTKTYESPKMVDGKLSYTLYNDKGESVGQTLVDPGTDMSLAQFNYFTKGDDGLYYMSELPETSIKMDSVTGKVEIKAPKSMTETEQFKQIIDEDQLKQYSQAYKTNHDYKLQIREKNEETGEEENKEITIPEYIERLNSSLTNYAQNLRDQKIYGYQLSKTYGDKASNLTDAQIVMSAQGEKGAKATYLPDTIFTVSSFGNGIDNPFLKLKNVRGENGEISAEELSKVWTRENFGREEVAALMSLINGHLTGSDWNKESYTRDADGNLVYNRNSAEEAAKLLAFKSYVLNNNPNAEWYQQAGDWIESASINFGTAFTNVFANLAVMGEGAVDMLPGVEAKSILNWKNEADQAFTNYNAINAQAWDAVVNAQIWGYIVGALTGSIAASAMGHQILKVLGEKTTALTTLRARQLAEEAGLIERGSAAWNAFTPQTMIKLYEGSEATTLGMRLWLNGISATNRASIAIDVASSAISGVVNKTELTKYLFDTLHDAIVFDGTTLRNVIEAIRSDDTNENRQQAVNFWVEQFAQNAVYWLPLGIAKTAIRTAGKTALGKTANAVLTKFINKLSSAVGYKKMSIRDKLANGSVVKKLESDIEEAIDDNKMTKAMRLQRKLDIENWNSLTRDARKRLGDLELKWEDGKLTEASLDEFNSFVNDVKVLENGIDAYNRNIVNKIDEYTVKQIDPSTGMRMYLNPDLGETNARVTMYYWDLVDLTKKHNLPIAKDSLLNQDVIDYWMNSFYKRLADKFADSDGLRALDAQNATVILQKNLDSLENVVPDEIKTYINNMLDRKVYQNWYLAQNEYGMAKGLLNRDKTIGYQENPIWAEVGYMPIKVQHDVSGKWIPDDGRIDAVIEQDWDSLKFKVAEGQHYADPELVRQSRLRKLAQADVSKDLFKAYKGFTNSATNVVKITGDQTRYVNTIKGNVEALDTAIDDGAANAFKENFTVRPQLDSDKKLSKNVFVPEDTSATVTAGMSPSQTTDFLVQKKILDGPNAKLTDKVTIDNYNDWFRQQSTPVQKYLTQKYSELDIAQGEDIISEELPMANNLGYSKIIATNEDYPGWNIGDHPVWALDESSTDFDGMTRRDYYRKVKGKEFRVIEMPSSDYNKVMMDDDIGRMLSSSEMKTANSYVDKFRNGERADIPFIQYDESGKIIGQEGRHRTIAAHKAGIEKTPVVIEYPTGSKLPENLKKYKDVTNDFVLGKKQTVKVSGGDVESSDVPVSMIPSKKTPAGETPQMSDEDFIQIASGENVRKIPVKKIQTPAESIFIDTGQPNSFALLERAISEGGDDFEAGLQRAYLSGDKSFRKTSIMNEAAKNLENGKEAFYQGVIMAKIKGETKNIPKLDVDAFWDEVLSTMRTQIDDYVARVTSSKGAMKAIETLAENSNGAEEAARYIALRQLKKKYMPDVKKIIIDKIDGLKQLDTLEKGDVNLLKKKAKLLFNDVVDTELDDATNVARVINSELVDSKDIYDKVKALADEIKGAEAKKADDYIMYLNDNGDQVFAQVDPAFASLYNTRAKITKSEASWMARFNAFTSRAFRYGTTSVNLSAFGNQMFRDFGNAVLVGGAWQTIKTNADNLRDVFGDSIVEQIKTFDPDDYEFRQVAKIAEQSGQTMQQAAVSRELMRGSAIAGTTTETSLYRDFMKQAYGEKSDDILNRAEGKLKELWKKYDPDKYMNGKRENYLRNRVYAHSLNDALNEGYTLAQARTYAEFAMNNATTNFSRQLYHMQAIADSTPYFRATINGTKSFWRMWSLDPVGISGRIMGGLILPTMFLTGASLGSEENRKVYQNIPEYQKKDALVFVFNGEPVSIQIPQELSPIVSPFRQFVEYLYEANKNDFWELMSNDLLGFLPYDMTGFTAIDYDKMIDDPTFFDRTSRGFSRLFSQMAPVPLKSAYMIASGTDPYTGKWLRDPSYAYWNDETNSIEIMDEYQSDFARMFAKLFPKMNPAIADKVVSGVVGTTGSNLLSDIASLVNGEPVEAAKGVGEHLFKQATNPVTVEKYDLVDAIWKRAVRQLTNEKEDLLHSKEMVKLNNELSQTKDPEKRQKLLAERQNLTDAYKEKVAQMVERLSTVYEGSLDRKKFAAVVALLNFNSDAAYQAGSQFSSNIASEMYWNGRDEAIHTMERMGITGTSDMSIFGYLTLDKEGKVVMRYSSPTAIMDMKSQWENQNDINAANIKALLSENNMYDAHKAVSDQISKIYDSKSRLTNQDKANIEAIQINWNAQLAKVIAPYVSQMTPEAAINNTTVMNLLYPYVEVPGSWETNDKGKSVYLGERGNKKRAYYDSWIKSMFSVNDKYKGQY